MHVGLLRHAIIYDLDSVWKVIGGTPGGKFCFFPDYGHNLPWYTAKVNLVRLKVLKKNFGVCQACGLTPSFFALERFSTSRLSHLGLYSVRDGAEVLMTHDHIIPKAGLGKDSIKNGQCLCEPCNSHKADKHPTEGTAFDLKSLLNVEDYYY